MSISTIIGRVGHQSRRAVHEPDAHVVCCLSERLCLPCDLLPAPQQAW
jgi:hypothetical protein